MKPSVKYIAVGVLLIGVGLVLFTPILPKLRAYTGRIISYSSIKLKADKTIPENTYDWELTDLNTEAYSFQNEKEKVVFLNLWATWCKPCLEEMPDIQALYDDYGDKVSFMLVSEEKFSIVNNFVLKKGYSLPFFIAENKVPEIFTSSTIPTTYVISKQGKISMAENGAVDWNSDKIRKLLDQLLVE
ncbi:TlpA family protein disulfide reductase [Zobellia nedashkovskayae]